MSDFESTNGTAVAELPAKAKRTKTPKKPAKITPKKVRKSRPNDQCREWAKHSDLTTGQIRVLHFLSSQRLPVGRTTLKEGVGIQGLYSQGWLNELKALDEKRLIRITIPEEGERGFRHEISALGRKALEKAKSKAEQAK